jgi:hypothetical protein
MWQRFRSWPLWVQIAAWCLFAGILWLAWLWQKRSWPVWVRIGLAVAPVFAWIALGTLLSSPSPSTADAARQHPSTATRREHLSPAQRAARARAAARVKAKARNEARREARAARREARAARREAKKVARIRRWGARTETWTSELVGAFNAVVEASADPVAVATPGSEAYLKMAVALAVLNSCGDSLEKTKPPAGAPGINNLRKACSEFEASSDDIARGIDRLDATLIRRGTREMQIGTHYSQAATAQITAWAAAH